MISKMPTSNRLVAAKVIPATAQPETSGSRVSYWVMRSLLSSAWGTRVSHRARGPVSSCDRGDLRPSAQSRRREQSQYERRHHCQEAVDEDGGDHARVVPAEAEQGAGQTELDDADASRCDWHRAEQAGQRPGREGLDD